MSFLVYKSSAGSGKTFTLVKEYLTIALGSENPFVFKTILAVTFTNKAANEMTERVISQLEKLSGLQGIEAAQTNEMVVDLCKSLHISQPELQKRSRKVLKAIVHNYREFSIGTIDSFVHRVIRSFAQEMGLSQQFEVELNSEEVLHRAVDLMLEQVGENQVLTDFIKDFVSEKIADEKSWNVESDMYEFAKPILNTHEYTFLEKAIQVDLKQYKEVRDQLKKEANKFRKQIQQIATEALEYALDGVDPRWYSNRACIITYFKKKQKKDFSPELGINLMKVVSGECKWEAGKLRKDEVAAVQEKKEKLMSFYYKIEELMSSGYTTYQLQETVASSIYKVALLAEISAQIEKIKKENNIVMISEFNDLVGKITRTEPVPFIYEKLGEKYTHFLFDEFQDTSLTQFQNMLPLIHNSLSNGGTSLVVGDAKQSIYRWRGGEVDQFAMLPELYNPFEDPFMEENGRLLAQCFKESDSLKTNYRSLENIVLFNNAFFEKIKSFYPEVLGNYYDTIQQKTRKSDGLGCVELQFVTGKVEDTQVEIGMRISKLINKLVKEHNYAYRDIAILTRTKKKTPALVSLLMKEGIPVISAESLLVSNSTQVQLVVAALNHIIYPKEPYFMGEILIRLNEFNPIEGFHNLVSDLNKITESRFLNVLNNWGVHFDREFLSEQGLYSLVNTLTDCFQLYKKPDDKLATFVNFVFGISQKTGFGIIDFIHRWQSEKEKLSIQIPESVDAVNVLTIHKSKGLDWPVVILAEGNWVDGTLKQQYWVDLPEKMNIPVARLGHKALETCGFTERHKKETDNLLVDNLNNIYVAFTRPSECLFSFIPNPTKYFFGKLFPAINDVVQQQSSSWYKKENEKGGLEQLRFGTIPSKKRKSENDGNNLVKISNQVNLGYRKKLKVKKNYLSRMNNIGQKDFGTLVHHVFSQISYPQDMEGVLERLTFNGEIAPQEKIEVEDLVKSVMNHPQVQPFFGQDWEVKNEQEIILSNGNLLRPDRVLRKGSEVKIVDYKTGLPQPSHQNQVLEYKREIEKMGNLQVQAYLIYTQPISVVEV